MSFPGLGAGGFPKAAPRHGGGAGAALPSAKARVGAAPGLDLKVNRNAPIALIFPGQGSQYVGMGAALYENFVEAREVFDAAERILDFPVAKLCFEGPEEALDLTENTQPAILTVSIAALRVLEAGLGIKPQWTAGHSLGEYSALVCAGTLSFEEALRVVRERGRLMQEAVPAGRGAMAAVLGLDAWEVEEVCRASSNDEIVAPANLNGGRQVVISGTVAAVERAAGLALSRGARRVLQLPVSAPFHCPLMQPAAEGLREVLDPVRLRELSVGVVTNVEAKVNREPSRVKELMVDQVVRPVRWEETVLELGTLGCEGVVEVGPGRVLCGLNRRIQRDMKVFSIEKPEDFPRLAAEFGE